MTEMIGVVPVELVLRDTWRISVDERTMGTSGPRMGNSRGFEKNLGSSASRTANSSKKYKSKKSITLWSSRSFGFLVFIFLSKNNTFPIKKFIFEKLDFWLLNFLLILIEIKFLLFDHLFFNLMRNWIGNSLKKTKKNRAAILK